MGLQTRSCIQGEIDRLTDHDAGGYQYIGIKSYQVWSCSVHNVDIAGKKKALDINRSIAETEQDKQKEKGHGNRLDGLSMAGIHGMSLMRMVCYIHIQQDRNRTR